MRAAAPPGGAVAARPLSRCACAGPLPQGRRAGVRGGGWAAELGWRRWSGRTAGAWCCACCAGCRPPASPRWPALCAASCRSAKAGTARCSSTTTSSPRRPGGGASLRTGSPHWSVPLSIPLSHWPRRSAAVACRRGANPAPRSAPQDSAWKRRRRELLRHLERLLRALRSHPAPPGPAAAPPSWGRFLSCCAEQGLLPGRGGGPGTRPLCLVLDDNFYYRSMRHEVFQLARKCNSCTAPPAARGRAWCRAGRPALCRPAAAGRTVGGWQRVGASRQGGLCHPSTRAER